MKLIKLNKTQAREKINKFFESIENKNKEDIRKIKRLAMHYKIKLKNKKQLFCKYCFSTKLKTKKIRKDMITKECEDCKKLMRWKI